jgi:hypothetical protein
VSLSRRATVLVLDLLQQRENSRLSGALFPHQPSFGALLQSRRGVLTPHSKPDQKLSPHPPPPPPTPPPPPPNSPRLIIGSFLVHCSSSPTTSNLSEKLPSWSSPWPNHHTPSLDLT